MSVTVSQPTLDQLYGFIAQIPKYPISTPQIINLAQKTKAPSKIVRFYESFGQNLLFKNEDELVGRTEQVGIMRQQKPDMPPEQQTAPEEY